MQREEIIKLFRKNKGYLSSANLQKYKVHTSIIREMVEQGELERIKRGIYRLTPENLPQDETFTYDYFDAVMSVPKGVFCLRTALYYYGLTTFNLAGFDMAILPTNRNSKILTVNVRFFRFQEPYYSNHIETIKTSLFPLKIYSQERTVCDIIRLRHLVDEDIAMEGLNNYIKKSQKDINKLFAMAKFCKVRHIVEPAVKAMTGF